MKQWIENSIPCLVILGLLSPVAAVAAPDLPHYEGLLRESDIRLSQIREALKKKEPLPDYLFLRYQGREGNYVVFYDLDGRTALFRYRKDRFDDLAERKIRDLLPGQAYRLPLKFVGLIERGVVYAEGTAEFQRLLDSDEGRPAFEFVSPEPRQPDFILY
jgi:hypothetical protein